MIQTKNHKFVTLLALLLLPGAITGICYFLAVGSVASFSARLVPDLNGNYSASKSDLDQVINESTELPKALSTGPKRKPKILFWTTYWGKLDFVVGLGDEIYRKNNCPFVCEHTTSKEELSSSDALMFHVIDNYNPLPTRLPHQKWVYMIQECPAMTYSREERIDEFFNWTMTFYSKSDIWIPYSMITLRKTPIPVKPVSIQGKKLVAWLVSNCQTPGQREVLYEKLSKYIPIDKRGNCGGGRCNEKLETCYSNFAKEYLFYLSWENSLCEDYITEKLWGALSAGIVPIVYGGADYAKYAPPGSIIDALSFNSVKELAAYIQYLSTNATAYQEYHRWNENYEFVSDTYASGWCRMCEKLYREQDSPTTTKVKISDFWSTDKLCSSKNEARNRLFNNP